MTDHVRVAFDLWVSRHPEASPWAAWAEAHKLAAQHDLARTNELYMPVLQVLRLMPMACPTCNHAACQLRRALAEFWKELRT